MKGCGETRAGASLRRSPLAQWAGESDSSIMHLDQPQSQLRTWQNPGLWENNPAERQLAVRKLGESMSQKAGEEGVARNLRSDDPRGQHGGVVRGNTEGECFLEVRVTLERTASRRVGLER